MFSRRLRLLFVFVSIGIAANAALQGQPWMALLFAAVGLFLWLNDSRNGSVSAAMGALRRGKLQEAAKRIEECDPQKLSPEALARYHWVQAALAEGRGELGQARTLLEKAVEGELDDAGERTVALATLASVLHRLGEQGSAERRLAEAEALNAGPRVAPVLKRARNDIGLQSKGRD